MIFIAKPPPKVLAAMTNDVSNSGLDALLGSRMFAPENWHQSFSMSCSGGPELRDALLRVGARISAAAFTMTLNGIRGLDGPPPIHWEFVAQRRPVGFDAVRASISAGLADEGFDELHGRRPHVTISYRAAHPLPRTKISPIPWKIDEILLVEGGGGHPYRYVVIERWPLLPTALDPVDFQYSLW
jgi:2'-5' RNA ligase